MMFTYLTAKLIAVPVNVADVMLGEPESDGEPDIVGFVNPWLWPVPPPVALVTKSATVEQAPSPATWPGPHPILEPNCLAL